MSKWIFACVCVILLAVGALSINRLHAADAPVPTTQPKAPDTKPVNTKCPVTGEDIDPKVTTVYEGKTVAFCCADCVKAFNKNPEKYVGNLK